MARTGSSLLSALLVGALAVLAGIVPGALPVTLVASLAGAGGLLLAALMVRHGLARRALPADAAARGVPDAGDHEPDVTAAVPEAPELRLARKLFYGGCLLVGFQSYRYGGLTLSESLFIAALACCAVCILRGGELRGLPGPLIAAALVFAVGAGISSVDAQSPTSSAYQLVHGLYVLLLWPAVGALVLRTRRQVVTAVTLWGLSAALDGVGALGQLAGVHWLGLTAASGRMTGFTEHPNDLGGVCAMALVPALMVTTRPAAGRLARGLGWPVVALIAAGLTLSGSVSSMAAAAVATLLWMSSPAVGAASRVAVAAAVIAVMGVAVIGGGRVSSPLQRLSQIGNAASANGGSLQDRLSIAAQAWPRIKQDPFVGTGLDTADSGLLIISHGGTGAYQIHGLPLAAWYQTGVIGMLGLLGVLAALVATAWRSMRSALDTDEFVIGLALLASVLTFIIFAMTQPMVFQQYGWISAVFAVAWSRRTGTARNILPGLSPAIAGRPAIPA